MIILKVECQILHYPKEVRLLWCSTFLQEGKSIWLSVRYTQESGRVQAQRHTLMIPALGMWEQKAQAFGQLWPHIKSKIKLDCMMPCPKRKGGSVRKGKKCNNHRWGTKRQLKNNHPLWFILWRWWTRMVCYIQSTVISISDVLYGWWSIILHHFVTPEHLCVSTLVFIHWWKRLIPHFPEHVHVIEQYITMFPCL